jgi:hypothetical protein
VYLSVKTTRCGGLLAGVQSFPYSEVTLGLVPLEWGGLMFLFLDERVYLSRIRLSLVSELCWYVAPICVSVVCYVDDILIAYNQKQTNIKDVLTQFNNSMPTMKFTMEEKQITLP